MLAQVLIVTFVLCLGLAALSILLSRQLLSTYASELVRHHFFYLAAFYAFAFYGLWGPVLARGLRDFFSHGDTSGLDTYSERCLRRVWRVQHFSWWMTQMLHRLTDDPFEAQLQRSQLDYVVRSRAAATTLAENYVGLELEDV